MKPEFNFNKISMEDIKLDAERLVNSNNGESHKIGLFEIHTANEIIKLAMQQPDPVQLYPNLILENELTIVFADTGLGKTVLCFQAAIEISKAGYTVLYLDLELSRKQFQRRYTSKEGVPYKLPDNLFRLEFARLKKVPNDISYEDYFFDSLISAIKEKGAKVIFLDNLTKLAAGDTDSAKAAIPILERLNELKFDFGLTIIVLEHNKKVDTSRPIQLNDLQGSKMKSNLVDAVFSIGKSSKDKNVRYIKQCKVRDGEMIYDTENVKVCELSKEKGYLSFTDIGFDSEYEHLKQFTNEDKEQIESNIIELKTKSPVLSLRQIADKLGTNQMKVKRTLERNGKV